MLNGQNPMFALQNNKISLKWEKNSFLFFPFLSILLLLLLSLFSIEERGMYAILKNSQCKGVSTEGCNTLEIHLNNISAGELLPN